MLLSKLNITFRKLRKERFFLIAPLTLGIVFISSLLVYYFEHNEADSTIRSVWDAIWWAVVTICTVGYGDKFPVSDGGKMVGIVLMLSGIGLLSMLTATVASVLVEQKIKEGKGLKAIKENDHIVICGWNQYSEEVLSYLNRSQKDCVLVLINELTVDVIDSLKVKYNRFNMTFLRGNYIQEDVLNRANIQKARFAIIMADTSSNHPIDRADDRTILTALTIKSLSPQIKMIAELVDAGNKTHLKRANVDEIVIRGEHMGYLLASAVDSPGLPRVFEKMLSVEDSCNLFRAAIPKEYINGTFAEISSYFRNQRNAIVVGILQEKKPIKLDDLLSDNTSALDAFIKEKLKESKRDYSKGEDDLKVVLNPKNEYVIKPEDFAIILCSAAPPVGQQI
jgi:voltage-gated potassium channel